MSEHDEEGYAGPATVLLEDAEIEVSVVLRGYFQPIDGYYHWYGRIAANQALSDAVAGVKKTAVLRTPEGEATGQIADPDPWNRLRITGTSTPPYRLPTSLEEIEGAGKP
jgi:hypothetical protein